MKKNDNKIFIAFSIVLLILIINIAYAYFASNKNLNNTNINVSTSTKVPVFTAIPSGELTLNEEITDSVSASTTEAAFETSANIEVSLLSYKSNFSASEEPTTCTYDIYFNYIDKDFSERTYTISTQGYSYELSLEGSRSITDTTSGKTYLTKSLSQTDIFEGSLVENNNKILLISGADIYSKSDTAESLNDWTFTLKYYVLPIDQASLTFSGYLSVENINCE